MFRAPRRRPMFVERPFALYWRPYGRPWRMRPRRPLFFVPGCLTGMFVGVLLVFFLLFLMAQSLHLFW